MKKIIKFLPIFLAIIFSNYLCHSEQNFVVDGSTYPYPDVNEEGWGQKVTDWSEAVTNKLTKISSTTASSTSTLKSRVDDHDVFRSTAQTRLNNLDLATASIRTVLGYISIDTSTLKTRIDGHDLFIASASVALDYSSHTAEGFNAFQATASASIEGYRSFISTGQGSIEGYRSFISTGEGSIQGYRNFISTGEGSIAGFSLFISSFQTNSANISSITVFGTITSTSMVTVGSFTIIGSSLNFSGMSYLLPISAPQTGMVMTYDDNGRIIWKTPDVSPISGGVQNWYLYEKLNTDIGSGLYETLLTTPSTGVESSESVTLNSGSGFVLISSHAITNAQMGSPTSIPVGEGGIHYHAKVDNSGGVTYLIMKYSTSALDGTTGKYNWLTTTGTEINSTSFTSFDDVGVLTTAVPLTPTTAIILEVYAKTDSAANRTVSFAYEGTSNASFVRTTILRSQTSLDSLTAKMNGFDVFKSSFESTSARISSLTVYATITSSTGFIGGSSTFTTCNAGAFIGDGSRLTGISAGGGTSGTGYEYYSYAIGDYWGTDASSQTVNCSSNTSYCFEQFKTELGATDGGKAIIRKGTYTFLSTFEVPRNMSIDFEKGAVVKNNGDMSVISVSGTVTNMTCIPQSTWVSDWFVIVNSSGVVKNLTIENGSIGDLLVNTVTKKKSVVTVEGLSPILDGYKFWNNAMGGSTSEKNMFLYVKNTINGTISGIDVFDNNAKSTSWATIFSTDTVFKDFKEVLKGECNYCIDLRLLDDGYAVECGGLRNKYTNIKASIGAASGYVGTIKGIDCDYSDIKLNEVTATAGGFYVVASSACTLTNSSLTGFGNNAVRVEATDGGSHLFFLDGVNINRGSAGISDSGDLTMLGTRTLNGVKSSD